MGTAHFSDDYADEYNHDLTIAKGLSTIWFNPSGDPVGSEVDHVRFKFHIDHNGGQKFDLGDIDIWMVSPNGETNRIYYNFDGFGDDTDDGNDSDRSDDYDISFWGTDLISSIAFGFDGNQVNGNWGLRIDNDTGITLDLNYLEVWVDYNTVADLKVKDIRLSGAGGNEVGTPMLIETWIENEGGQRYGEKIELEYLVNDVVIGTSELTLGLNAGVVNYESELYSFDQAGQNKVSVRIVGADDVNQSNNSRTEFFNFPQPDLVVSDVRVLGDWNAGDTVEIRPFIENIGGDAWNLLKGTIKVEYSIDGQVVGSDSLSWGLTPHFGDWESFEYTLTSDGPHTVTVRVFGNDPEESTANNSWTEEFGNDHTGGDQKTVANSAFDVHIASFLIHTIYGGDAVPDAEQGSDDNGLNDDYRGYLADAGWTVLDDGDFGQDFRPNDGKAYFGPGGLFIGDAEDINIFTSFASQGLVATGYSPEGEKTLTLTFRGTDGDDAVDAALGQSFTGNGIYNYYEAMRPLIDAAIAYANDPANDIEKVVVAGHSLGGATADLFALVDAHRLSEDIDLTVVSLASAGLHPKAVLDAYGANGMDGQYDTSLVNISDLGGNDESVTFNAPSYYIGISFSNDTVTFDRENPTTLPLTPNFTLNNNENFDDGLLAIDLPNVSPTDPVDGGLADQFGFGAEHSHGLYWAIVGMLAKDNLVKHLGDHKVIAGETDYDEVATLSGDPLGVFAKWANVKADGYQNDRGDKALTGSNAADYILGLDGHDQLFGRGGSDLLSGGNGNDIIKGEAGADRLSGGEGSDALRGGAGRDKLNGDNGHDKLFGDGGKDALWGDDGNDILRGGNGRDNLRGGAGDDRLEDGGGADTLNGGAGADVFMLRRDNHQDVITDFADGEDRIELAGFDFNDLRISDRPNGSVRIAYGDDAVILRDASDSLVAAHFTQADFIFA